MEQYSHLPGSFLLVVAAARGHPPAGASTHKYREHPPAGASTHKYREHTVVHTCHSQYRGTDTWLQDDSLMTACGRPCPVTFREDPAQLSGHGASASPRGAPHFQVEKL